MFSVPPMAAAMPPAIRYRGLRSAPRDLAKSGIVLLSIADAMYLPTASLVALTGIISEVGVPTVMAG